MRVKSSFWLSLAVAISFAAAGARAADSAPPPEPETYRLDNYRAPTPATLDAQPGLITAEAEALWKSKDAVFVDVLPHVPRPANLAEGTIWREKPRDDIPGSIWLPDTGYGALAPETEAYLRAGLAAVTGGALTRKIVFYCLKDCWMSWNAAKRAKTFGYTKVFWYPWGTEGWAEAGLPLEDRKPYPRN
ncbi:PQQ-dependent catabolism-associated CXXCW motif protein [Methyloferula stellata]|uniref:PQQ-dependent catabolism-associated CXXCW motif protein n=1 Tax=Methyloferula stellata TaxID=876270 RepID=UPI0003A17C9A|nr:PQQ-dependent catabolism-associated CXXCW motif protein [Methyloferula stellata]